MGLLFLMVVVMSPPLSTDLESSLSMAAIYAKSLFPKERTSQRGKIE